MTTFDKREEPFGATDQRVFLWIAPALFLWIAPALGLSVIVNTAVNQGFSPDFSGFRVVATSSVGLRASAPVAATAPITGASAVPRRKARRARPSSPRERDMPSSPGCWPGIVATGRPERRSGWLL